MTDPAADAVSSLHCLHYLDAIREERGGVVRAVLDLVGGLADAGAEVTLLTGDATDAPSAWVDGRPGKPKVVTIRRAMTPLLAVGGADRAVVGEHLTAADVLHLHTPWDRYNVALAAAARRLGLPYVVSAHGMLDDWCMAQKTAKKRLYLQAVGRRMLRNAYAVHCTAEGEQRQALPLIPGAAGRVVPLLLDLAPYANPPGTDLAQREFPSLATEDPKLLFLSRLHPKKGVERLIRVAATLRERGIPVELFLAGPGDDSYVDQLKKLANKVGVEQQTHFLGMVRGELKLSLYQACDLFVLPTSQENFGIVLAEAMASGLPTVTTHGVDIAPELEQHGAVIVSDVATGDEQELADAITRLLDAPSPETFNARMRAGVLEWLDPPRVIAGYLDLYRDAVRSSLAGVR